MPRNEKVDLEVGVPVGVLGLLGTILYARWWVKRRRERRRPRGTIVELNDRREGSDKSGPDAQPTEGVIPNEVEGSLVGPVEMDANQTHVAPTNPPPYGVVAPNVAPEGNPLSEPLAAHGSWYAPNLGTL
ncbi:MAG: hypothetical protein Q9175_002912 [Cornicularia normoerica]